MSKSATEKGRKVFRLSPEKGYEIFTFVLAFLVVFLAASLLSFHSDDPSVLHISAGEDTPVRNVVGATGANIAALLFSLMGLTALLLPVALGVVVWRRFKVEKEDDGKAKERFAGLTAVFFSLPAITQLLFGEIFWRGVATESGGVLGVLVFDALVDRLNVGGAFLVLATVLAVGASLTARTTLGAVLVAWRARLAALWERLVLVRWRRRRERERVRPPRPRARPREVVATAQAAPALELRGTRTTTAALTTAALTTPTLTPPALETPRRVVKKTGEGHFSVRKVVVPTILDPGDTATDRATADADRQDAEPTKTSGRPARRRKTKQTVLAFDPQDDAPARPSVPEEVRPGAAVLSPEGGLPPVNLLETEKPAAAFNQEQLVLHGAAIRKAASEFGVEGTVEGASPGPVITTYEFQPAPGVKVSKIVNLQDDLALTLRAESVRIDRIPGRSTLGIEVPNDKRSVINLGSMLADERFAQAPSVLTMAIGVDLNGRPYFADLARMPHLLVAGATGAGKSVGLQSMITSMVYKATRDNVQFIFIDPKRIELGRLPPTSHTSRRRSSSNPSWRLERAALGGGRDGAPLPAVGGGARALDRLLQPGDRGPGGTQKRLALRSDSETEINPRRSSSGCRTTWWSSTSWRT